jgi:hypothetical protein
VSKKDDANKIEKDGDCETHPSWGLVGLYRTSGGGKRRLFGSALSDHQHTMHLRVARAERKHDLGSDRTYARREIIDIEMSAAQFAEMITTPNVGSGVPCTIRYVEQERIPDPPVDDDQEVDRIKGAFKDDMKTLAAKLLALTELVEDTLDKKSIGVKDKDAIRNRIAMIVQEVSSNMPFMLSQFAAATDKVKAAAKAEVEAFMTTAVQRAGLKAIEEQGLDALPDDMRPPRALPEAEDVVPDWDRFTSLGKKDRPSWRRQIKAEGETFASGAQTVAQLRKLVDKYTTLMYVDDEPSTRGDAQFRVASLEYALRLRAKVDES